MRCSTTWFWGSVTGSFVLCKRKKILIKIQNMCFTSPISVGFFTCFININAFELCIYSEVQQLLVLIMIIFPWTSFTKKYREGNVLSFKGYYNKYLLVSCGESYSIPNTLSTREISVQPFSQCLFHLSVLFGCFYALKTQKMRSRYSKGMIFNRWSCYRDRILTCKKCETGNCDNRPLWVEGT